MSWRWAGRWRPRRVLTSVLPSTLCACRYLVLGSDGLFDVLQNKAIARIACKMNSNAQKVCNELQKELRKKPTGDDCTMVVLHFATQ